MKLFSFKAMGTFVAVIVSVLILIAVGNSLLNLGQQSRATGLDVAEKALEKAVMQCYALEGAYPPNLEYLEQNYGLIIDRQKYVYLYEIVAGNIHPIIGIQFPAGGES